MKRYMGTEKGPRGVYLNLSSGEFIQLREGAGVLPGKPDVKYLKVPSALAVVFGPLTGLVFIIFLPFVGVIGAVGFIAYRLWQGARALERRVAQLFAVDYQPGRAYFTHRDGKAGKKPGAKTDDEMKALEGEIAKRKQRGEQ
ncbi:MAG: hypothetical protein ABID87_07240 [Chloroflexota bacterium]